MRSRFIVKFVITAFFAVAPFILSGCAAKKSPESLRALNAGKDIQFSKANENEIIVKSGNGTVSVPQISGTITLDEAIAYALTHNLNAAVSKTEEEVQREMSTAAMMKMLPALIANVERSWKSRHVPSKSVNYTTGAESLAPSISSELETATESVELSWDLLDLAINVNRWKQSGDRVRIRALQLRRIKQNLAFEVTGAYLRAAVAKDAAKQAEKVIGYALQRQEIIDTQMEKGHIPKIDGLQSSIDIAELLIRLTRYSDEYKASKTELARLLGVAPTTPFELVDIDFASLPGQLIMSGEDMGREAMLSRPELFELDIEEQITSKDAEIAIMSMFPDLTPFVRYQHDANKFLTRHDWFVSGLKLSWDMLSIPEAYAEQQTAAARERLVRKRRMNMAMAVLTQLRLAVIEYENYMRQVEQALELEKLRKDLAVEVHQQVETGRLKESTLLNADQLYIVAHHARLTAAARLLTARQRILNSMGRDWDAGGKKIVSTANDLEVALQ
ncbi:TolC family protein [Maridesulfovibrio sp.]|uniref:TolC family protein n=1 Tax=Maridesulfovibrio sp. TaxID=2795000 RepID=UPI002AA7303B|nr:TolC family protein [Maridesulfovibrio sp.]